jgi:3-oxoacyl-[acyl-carrier-protein] synthase-3
VILSRADLVEEGHAFLGGVSRAATEHCDLCVASPDHMTTDVRGLLTSSLDIAKELWLAGQSGEYFNDEAVSLYAVHQVSEVHTRRVGDVLGVDQNKVPRIFPTFGNTGPSSIPMVLSKEVEAGNVKKGDRISLLGFGSGLNAAAYEVIW